MVQPRRVVIERFTQGLYRWSAMRTRLTVSMCCLFGVIATFALPLLAADVVAPSSEEHAHHHHTTDAGGTRRSVLHYQVPDVELVRDDGRHVSLPAEMNDGR